MCTPNWTIRSVGVRESSVNGSLFSMMNDFYLCQLSVQIKYDMKLYDTMILYIHISPKYIEQGTIKRIWTAPLQLTLNTHVVYLDKVYWPLLTVGAHEISMGHLDINDWFLRRVRIKIFYAVSTEIADRDRTIHWGNILIITVERI